MLEHGSLLVRPRRFDGRRLIEVRATGDVVGFACRASAARGWFWRLWTASTIEVREQDDAPLVFTMRRELLAARFEVCEAEGRRVGFVRGLYLEDAAGRRLARLRRGPDRGRTCYCTANGLRMAELLAVATGVELHFADVLKDDPFIKMLLLASVLRF